MNTSEKMMKKVLKMSGILILILSLLSSGVTMGEEENMEENHPLIFSTDRYGQIDCIRLPDSRSLPGSGVCSYAVSVNVSTGDCFKSGRGEVVIVTPEDASECKITSEKKDEGLCIQAEHEYQIKNGILAVTQSTQFRDGSNVAEIYFSVENRCENAVVTKLEYKVNGLEDSPDHYSLLWPDKEGKIYEQAFLQKLSLHLAYPSPMSMQYITLFDKEHSLYFGVHDPKREYKEFSYSSDGSFSVTLYPFAEPGQKKEGPCIELGVFGGGWYDAADHYRTYLLENGFTKKNAPVADTFSGITSHNLTQYSDRYLYPYSMMNGLAVSDYKEYGTPVSIFMGWHEQGFDSKYPDYEFIDNYGGAEAFEAGIAQLHKRGCYAAVYLNLHISETTSKWYNTKSSNGYPNGLDCALLTPYSSVYHEQYGTGLDYVAMCPMAPAWQNAITDAVERVRSRGADALWFDQLMEMPAVLCYNREHGHTTPATAYAEGYDSLLEKIDRIMARYGSNYFYCCEGTSDAYIRYIDFCGLMWARLFHSDKNDAPEITRYTIPAKFFGLQTAGQAANPVQQYRDAWLMADGMLIKSGSPVITRFKKLCDKYPQIYCRGRYLDALWLGEVPDGLLGSVIKSAEDPAYAIQLVNTTKEKIVFEWYPPAGMFPEGTVPYLTNAETGKSYEKESGYYRIEIKASDILSILVSDGN